MTCGPHRDLVVEIMADEITRSPVHTARKWIGLQFSQTLKISSGQGSKDADNDQRIGKNVEKTIVNTN